MRKLVLSIAAMLFMAGLVVAAEVTLVKYDKDKKELTVKDADGKEKTYKIGDKTKFTVAGKDGDKEGTFENTEKLLTTRSSSAAARSSGTSPPRVTRSPR